MVAMKRDPNFTPTYLGTAAMKKPQEIQVTDSDEANKVTNSVVKKKRKKKNDGADNIIDVESCKREYKRAKKAYKHDKSNEQLKVTKSTAKRALGDAMSSSLSVAMDNTDGTSTKTINENEDDAIVNKLTITNTCTTTKTTTTNDIKLLQEAYQSALLAFKADKSNKDLRRSKTAARRALDNAILASATEGDKQLTCTDCSQKFIHTTEQQERYKEMGWKDVPKHCEKCKSIRTEKHKDDERRGKIDSRKKNMCYAYQRGECVHGNKCKFSHNPNFGGKRSNNDNNGESSTEKIEKRKTVVADDEEKGSKDGGESRERKERGLKKKGKWRNK